MDATTRVHRGPDLIGLELRNKKAVLTFDRNCELLDCDRVSFSLAAGFDSPDVLDLPASDDVCGPANSHGRSVINTSSRASRRVLEHRRAFSGLYPTRSAASAETPPKKYVRADYCRKNQEASCYRHWFTLASAKVATTSNSIKPSHVAMGYHAGAGSLFARAGNPFISHQALAKIIGSQNSIGMAHSPCSAGKF
jgi:hypothetical protein